MTDDRANPTASGAVSGARPPRLLGPVEVRTLAAGLDLRPTKQRGQNFVIDANTVRRIVADSKVTAGDVVLEVGPGLGSLTLALLAFARRVVALEIDPVLAAALPATIADRAPDQVAAFEVVLADALQVDSVPGPPPTALVANLPYNVSVPVLLHMLDTFPSLRRVLVMVQKEVADRIAAAPDTKDYGALAVWIQSQCRVQLVRTLPPSVFWPRPKVTSAILHIELDPELRGRIPDLAFFHDFVRSLFLHRRKFLRSVLVSALKGRLDKAGVDEVLEAASLTPQWSGKAGMLAQGPIGPLL